MPRQRKRHVQQELFRHGGKRKGAGRKPKGKRAGSAHQRRPTVNRHKPLHIVLRAHNEVGSLRKRFMYRALREATIAVAMRELAFDDVDGAFRIVHISIQKTHVHLLVEADNKRALSRGMQSFQISAAKHINAEYSAAMKLPARRRGSVFPDRFHEEIITTPRQARNALAYVLNNWRKHGEDQGLVADLPIDPFSSAISFNCWREREGAERWRRRDSYLPLVVYEPKSWLLTDGWMKYGKISLYEKPSALPVSRN